MTTKIVLEIGPSRALEAAETSEIVSPIKTKGEHLTIFRAGIQSSGLFPGIQTEHELLLRGDLLIVNSIPEGVFETERIAFALAPYLTQYESITFDGASMGVPVLYEIMRFAKKLSGVTARLTMVLRDPIATTQDLAPWMRVGGYVTPLFSGRNLPAWVGEKLLFADTYPDGETLTEQEAELLKQHEIRSRTFPAGYWFSEFDWLRRFPGPDSQELKGIKAVALKSVHDGLLRESAIKSWSAAFELAGYTLPILNVEGKDHCDLLQSPGVWAIQTAEAYNKLGIPILH